MFLVLEGIDGAGKGRQRIELTEYLKTLKDIQVESMEFPDHQGCLYKEYIKPYLLEKIKLSPESLFISFALDQLLLQDKIKLAKGSKKSFFLCDGYFTTNIVYNCLVKNSIDFKEAINFAKAFKINEADYNIYIDVLPEIALKRKSKEEGHNEGLDINERDLEKQRKIRESFQYLAKNNIFGKWIIVDGNGTIEEVKENIIKKLIEFKIIKKL